MRKIVVMAAVLGFGFACSSGEPEKAGAPEAAQGDGKPQEGGGVPSGRCAPADVVVTGLKGGVANGLTEAVLKAPPFEVAKVEISGTSIPCAIDLAAAEVYNATDFIGVTDDGDWLAVMDGTSEIRDLRFVNTTTGAVAWRVQSPGEIRREGNTFAFAEFVKDEAAWPARSGACEEEPESGIRCIYWRKMVFSGGSAKPTDGGGWSSVQ